MWTTRCRRWAPSCLPGVCTYHDSSVAPRFEYAEHTTCGASCVTLGLECAEVDMSGVGAGNGYGGDAEKRAKACGTARCVFMSVCGNNNCRPRQDGGVERRRHLLACFASIMHDATLTGSMLAEFGI